MWCGTHTLHIDTQVYCVRVSSSQSGSERAHAIARDSERARTGQGKSTPQRVSKKECEPRKMKPNFVSYLYTTAKLHIMGLCNRTKWNGMALSHTKSARTKMKDSWNENVFVLRMCVCECVCETLNVDIFSIFAGSNDTSHTKHETTDWYDAFTRSQLISSKRLVLTSLTNKQKSRMCVFSFLSEILCSLLAIVTYLFVIHDCSIWVHFFPGSQPILAINTLVRNMHSSLTANEVERKWSESNQFQLFTLIGLKWPLTGKRDKAANAEVHLNQMKSPKTVSRHSHSFLTHMFFFLGGRWSFHFD